MKSDVDPFAPRHPLAQNGPYVPGYRECIPASEYERQCVDDVRHGFKSTATPSPNDPVNHPSHYTSHPSGVECITITEHFSFNLGNAVKYIWRAGVKSPGDHIADLQKAAWYIERELQRLGSLPRKP